MLGALIAIAAVAAIAAVVWLLVRRSGAAARPGSDAAPRTHPAPPVAEFHVAGDAATVSFDVPLPPGEPDAVLRDLLIHEAVEVVREKRHHLPIGDVTRVVVLGRRDGAWHEVGSLPLATPGELPPPTPPILIAGLHREASFDPFDTVADLPAHAPGLQSHTGEDDLPPIASELRLPAGIAAGLRAQGIDPTAAQAGDLVLGILRLTGATITARDEHTHDALIGGRRTLIRLVPHRPGDHPELNDADVRRFAADFVSSGAERALLITEKYSPFEVYERERRNPRARYITRERVQHFVDALALG